MNNAKSLSKSTSPTDFAWIIFTIPIHTSLLSILYSPYSLSLSVSPHNSHSIPFHSILSTNTPTRVQPKPIHPNHSLLPPFIVLYKLYRSRRRSIHLHFTPPSPRTFLSSLSISAALSVNRTLCPSPLPELHFRSSPENSRFPSSHSENARIPHEGTRR